MADPILNVQFVRPEVVDETAKWKLIKDCLAGEQAVKSAGDVYLPRPNEEDKSAANETRYKAYIKRAVFYGATRRTLDGLVGQVFLRDPIVEIPPDLEALLSDADGVGVGIHEQAKKALSDTTSYGRVGLLVDYPQTGGVITRAQQESGYIRPTILLYQPEDIINWRTVKIGARRLLSLVVLQESYLAGDDGFMPLYQRQWRVLRLQPISAIPEGIQLPPDTAHFYSVELWRESSSSSNTPGSGPTVTIEKFEQFIPSDASGKPLEEIPFTFIGSINNDPDVDPAPLYDLAILNIAHYRNSADYEEACFLVGQPTVFAAGLTESWVNDVLKGSVSIGSRAVIPLPVGGTAGLLQVQANTLPKEAMDQKEKQMVALGARLVEQRNVQQTLGEAQQKEAAQTSILASVAKNVGAAYTRCLSWCALYQGSSFEKLKYELNTDFIAAQMTPEERAQLVAEWQGGAVSYTEMRTKLRKAGIATQKDEVAKAESEKDELRLKTSITTKVDGTGMDPNGGRTAPTQNSKTQKS